MAQWGELSLPTNVTRIRPDAICGLSLFLVLSMVQGFFSKFSGFPSLHKKTNIDHEILSRRE